MTPVQSRLPASYWRQWTASAISNLGDGINFVAMPLLVYSLSDDERILALTTFVLFVPWLLIALPVGIGVDRLNRKRLMVSSSIIRCGMFSLVGVLIVTGSVTIPLLLGLLLVIGSCEVVFDSAAQAFLPMLVDHHQLARANGLLFAAEVIAGSIAGLSVGALLFDSAHALPFAINALTFAIAALLILSIAVRPRSDPPPSEGLELRVGIAWLRSHRLLRTLAVMFAVTNFGLMFGQGVFVKYAIETLELSNTGYGILLAITAMGAATGGLIGHRVVGRFGLSRSVIGPYLVFGVAQLVIGIAPSAWLVGVAGFWLGGAITVWNVVTVTIRQQLIPADRFGRVNAVYRWLGASASAAGVASGGFLAYWTNLQIPFVAGGGVALLAAVVFGGTVVRGLRHGDHDQPDDLTMAPPSMT